NRLAVLSELIRKYSDIGFFCSNYAVREDRFRFRLVKQYSVLASKDQINFDAPMRIDPFKLLIVENFVGTASAIAVKKQIFQRIGGFDSRFRIADDLDFCLRAAMHTNFVVASQVLLYKRTHA